MWNGWRGDQWSVMEESRCSPLELLHTEMISVGMCVCVCVYGLTELMEGLQARRD